MSTKQLDFIIIGAMKSGTTSLYKYLNNHPEIYMLPEKESPFFSSDHGFKKGWEVYAKEHFYNAPLNKLWGKASPTYMPDLRVPQRLNQVNPNVKIIVLLRNPIDRVFSHYQHLLRQGFEERDFEELVQEETEENILREKRLLPGGLAVYNGYVTMGEYGRLIKAYLEFISHDNLLILFTEELEKNPQKTIKKTFDFLGVDHSFRPHNLEKRYHLGGKNKIIPIDHTDINSFLDKTEKFFLINKIFRLMHCFDLESKYKSIKRTAIFWFRIWNIKPEKEKPIFSSKIRLILKEAYQKDVELLSQILGREVPWIDFKLEK